MLPTGQEVMQASHIGELSTGKKDETLLVNGNEENEVEVFGDAVLAAPVTGEPCLYWWLEIAHETEKANYHLLTQISENNLYIRLGSLFIQVKHPKRGGGPSFVQTYPAGKEPQNAPCPSHSHPDTTYRLWLLKPQTKYMVRVEKFGSALPPRGPGERPRYRTFYHFTFR